MNLAEPSFCRDDNEIWNPRLALCNGDNFRSTRSNFDISDLVNLWRYSASRERLEGTVQDQAPCIDPSESESQYESFCSKLTESLQHGKNKLKKVNEDQETISKFDLSTN